MSVSTIINKHSQLQDKLAAGKRLRVLFINDIGFQYGAGIALLRQIQSFLVMGHEVCGICWMQGLVEGSIPLTPSQATGRWLGMQTLPNLHPSQGLSDRCIIDHIISEVKLKSPDVIVVGNIHGAEWSLKLISALNKLKSLVIAYMHDCYLVTGRCAYPGDCDRFLSGCNHECPTWNEYPSLLPEEIYNKWAFRREIFSGKEGVPLAVNSNWTLKMAQKSIPGLKSGKCIYYGLDEQLFRPMDKAFARKLLGIPQDKFVVLGGAVNMSDYRKGGHIFTKVVSKLKDKVHFVVFGAQSQGLPGIQGTGLSRDYRKMPIIYNAADIFVGTSLEEAFGQTFCEAAACNTPVVAFNTGGVPEIARHDFNARLAEDMSAESLIKEIEFFMNNPDKYHRFAASGRQMVEKEFSLQAQGDRWMEYIQSVTNKVVSGNW